MTPGIKTLTDLTPGELGAAMRARIGEGFCAELDELVRRAVADERRKRALRASVASRRMPADVRHAQVLECRARLADFEGRHGSYRTLGRAELWISKQTGYKPRRVRGYLAEIKSGKPHGLSEIPGEN